MVRCRASPHTGKGQVPRLSPELDDELSNRPLELDPGADWEWVDAHLGKCCRVQQPSMYLGAAGYFIIYTSGHEIVADHYTNIISKNGVACDPDTGKLMGP